MDIYPFSPESLIRPHYFKILAIGDPLKFCFLISDFCILNVADRTHLFSPTSCNFNNNVL